MPSSFVVTLEGPERLVPSFDDLHRLACWLLEGPASTDHEGQHKPFSVWPLSPQRPGRYEWRINWLPDDNTELLARLEDRLARGPRLGQVGLTVVQISQQGATFAELARLGPLWVCDVAFRSATYFSRSGRDYLLPDPELVVSRLADRWNHFCGADREVTADAVRDLVRRVVVAAHELATVRIPSARGDRSGFVGQARLSVIHRDEESESRDRGAASSASAARLFAALCHFAPYCGLGARTAHGLGAVAVFPVHG